MDKTRTTKEYLCLGRGAAEDRWRVDRPLTNLRKFSRRDRKRHKAQENKQRDDAQAGEQAQPSSDSLKQTAETEFETLDRFFRLSLIKARILTGRRHQIRRHLDSCKHQIIGDRQYGKSQINAFFQEDYGLSRMFLHSWRLQMPHPMKSSEIVTVTCGLPAELGAFLRRLPERPREELLTSLETSSIIFELVR